MPRVCPLIFGSDPMHHDFPESFRQPPTKKHIEKVLKSSSATTVVGSVPAAQTQHPEAIEPCSQNERLQRQPQPQPPAAINSSNHQQQCSAKGVQCWARAQLQWKPNNQNRCLHVREVPSLAIEALITETNHGTSRPPFTLRSKIQNP